MKLVAQSNSISLLLSDLYDLNIGRNSEFLFFSYATICDNFV